jgi:aspartate carbamoyltransferase catalytic subunit
MEIRHLTTIDDVSNEEIFMMFDAADIMSQQIEKSNSLDICAGYNMASLFFEPSTRTRLSFESAMYRLGGNVISVTETGSTSLAKGETIADTARIIGSYVDIIVVRHPWEGVPKVIADYAGLSRPDSRDKPRRGVPVINAGDGAHQHPTQTLTDLYTLRKEKGRIEGLTVALCGDLRYGRTVHSLAYALARFKANIVLISAHSLDMPDYIIKDLELQYGCQREEIADVGQVPRSGIPFRGTFKEMKSHSQSNVIASEAKQSNRTSTIWVLSGLWSDFFKHSGEIPDIDAFYLTRVQKERFTDSEVTVEYPTFDSKLLKKIKTDAILMHPLPRVDELAYEIDDDPRSAYFRQAAYGVPVRMALISFLLSVGPFSDFERTFQKPEFPRYENQGNVKCGNPKCISMQESESQQIASEFDIVPSDSGSLLRCVYCERQLPHE